MTTGTFRGLSFVTIGSAVLALGLIANPAKAVITTFQGSDPGAESIYSGLNSLLAASNFDAVAGAMGNIHLINFENVALGNFSSLNIAPGVTATLLNTDGGGISSEQNTTYGYNTTVGGSQFLQVRPTFAISTASLDFTFVEPIQGFGAYLTGLGTAAGELNVIVDNEIKQQLIVTGNPFGGSQFFGFITPEKLIRNISLTLSGITSESREIFGIDDVRYIGACVVK